MDESSLVSTALYKELLNRLRPQDRVIEVGDIEQHESVEAARIFHEQQMGGMRVASLTRIVRQANPELQKVVAELQAVRPSHAVALMEAQGSVSSVEKRKERLDLIATDFVAAPENALVISPDNESRKELNGIIRAKLQAKGSLMRDELVVPIHVARQELSKEDAKIAGSYEMDNVVQFLKGSSSIGIKAGEQVRVLSRDTNANTVTVQAASGIQTYNPRRHSAVGIFERQERSMSTGEQIVFKGPWKEKGIANGDTATLESLDRQGNAQARLADGRLLLWNLREMQRFDYAYASTSYGAQGATYDRVLVNMDTSEKGAKRLLSSALAYVALTRPRHEARIYTDDPARLKRILEQSEVKRVALSQEQIGRYGNQNQIAI